VSVGGLMRVAHSPNSPELRERIVGGRISVRNVTIEFGGRAGSRRAVEHASLEIEPGEFVCLLGPTGCGKSTLLNSLAGFIRPTVGSVQIDDQEVVSPGPKRGMVFQHHSLFPWKTVKRNVAFGPMMAGLDREQSEERARRFLDLVGLSAFADHYPHMLSGGMQQRVGIARALANYPSVLLMDEPFGALDAQTRAMMQESLLALWSEFGNTVVFVTHDVDEAVFLGSRVVVMSSSPGRLIADIPVPLPRPRDPAVLTAPEFIAIKRQCLALIREETLKAFAMANGG
jgi:NitT/TauT family transport system ATP-binding protein